MPIDRNLWKPRYDTFPRWPCPACSTGRLHVVDETLKKLDASAAAAGHDAWEPDWIRYRFCCLLRYDIPECAEIVALAGIGQVEEVGDGISEERYEARYSPKFFVDVPPIIQVADEVPETISQRLKADFALYWVDSDASANKIRAAVEALLDDQSVRKTLVDRNGKRRRIDLYNRIVAYKDRHEDAAKALLAIKWLGNVGSHSNGSGSSKSKVLNALDIFSHVLEVLYVRNAQRIARLAARINRQRGLGSQRRSAA